MAIESKRGCGYRSVGSTYAMLTKPKRSCDRLPFLLEVCPCCGEDYKFSRAIRIIDPGKMLGGNHKHCNCSSDCPVCNFEIYKGIYCTEDTQHFLEWIEERHYVTPTEFIVEAGYLGISRKMKNGVPGGMIPSESIVFLAHKKVIQDGNEYKPGIFGIYMPIHFEHICTESELHTLRTKPYSRKDRTQQLKNLEKKGVKLIAVPDNDPDHLI